MTSRPGRIGLSEYTAQRLAELKARRAEAEMSDGTLATAGAPAGSAGYSSAAQLNAQLSSNINNNSNYQQQVNAQVFSNANNGNHDRTASTPVISNVMSASHVRATSAANSSGSTDRLVSNSERPVEVVKPFDSSLQQQQQQGRSGVDGSSRNGFDHLPGPPDEKPPPPPSTPCPDWKPSDVEKEVPPPSTFAQKSLFPSGEIKKEVTDPSPSAQRNSFSNGVEQSRPPMPSSRLISSLTSMEQSRSVAGSASSLAASETRSSPESSFIVNQTNTNQANTNSYQVNSISYQTNTNTNQANTTARAAFGLNEPSSSLSSSSTALSNRMRSLSPNVRDISAARSLHSEGSNQSLYSGTGYSSSRVVTPLENGFKGRGSNAGINRDDDEECLGFASLQDQIQRKAIKRGFDLTIMVVGETGLGKSTLITSMFFGNDLYQDRTVPTALERLKKTVQIEKRHLEIEERGVKLRVTVVDTPGFNDSLNSDKCNKPVVEYIESQMEQYLKDESGLNRRNIKDNRVHCCLYFISPYGRGLRQVDVEFMKSIHDKVNVIPVIAKADTLTPTEIQRLKATVLAEIKKHKIQTYEIPQSDSDDEEEASTRDAELRNAIPFAVIGSNTTVEVNGRKVKGRVYPWGIVEVENPKHSDFIKLRQFLLSTHMQDLKDVTRDVHYENFRANHIREQAKRSGTVQRQRGAAGDTTDGNANTDVLLKQKEAEIKRMQEMLARMQAQMQK